jgi:hypothetical protein
MIFFKNFFSRLQMLKISYEEDGKDIIKNNPFYNTLSLFLKYHFVKYQEKDFYLMNFIKEITKNENEFKVFMVFKEYALYIYHTSLDENFKNNSSIDTIINTIIYYIKKSYDDDRNVIKPFITSINESSSYIIEKFHFIKSSYVFKVDTYSKFEKLKNAIIYLEKAREFEEESKKYRNLAMESLYDIKNHFEKSFINNKETPTFLTIKNL